jgi:FMN phosphatase YigB (HAD superfamily)
VHIHDNGSRPQLAIFDLDGTLYPRERYVEQVLAAIARGFVELRGATPQYAQEQIDVLRDKMRANWGGTSTTAFVIEHGFGVEEWQDFRARNLAVANGVCPDPTVIAQLARLRPHMPIALLTNNTRTSARDILRSIGLPDDAFDAVISAEDVGETPKPAPAAFGVVLAKLGVPAAHAWGIGDRYDIDVGPLRDLGGSGIVVSGPTELGAAIDVVISRASVAAR